MEFRRHEELSKVLPKGRKSFFLYLVFLEINSLAPEIGFRVGFRVRISNRFFRLRCLLVIQLQRIG